MIQVFLKIALFFIFLSIIINNQSKAQTWQELMDSTSYYQEQQDYQTALEWAFRAEAKAKQEFGEMDTNYVASITKIYYNYYYLGDANKALEYCEKAKPIVKQLRGEESPEYAEVTGSLGVFYNAIGAFDKAEPLYKEALEMRRRLFKGDHPHLAASINNMAVFYKARGNYTEAEPLYKEALEMYRRLFKGDHPHLAASINNMAVMYNAWGKFYEAETLLKEALEMVGRLFKGEHPYLATSINNMAYYYENIGNYKDAEPLYKEALEMRRRLFKGDHPDLTLSINNMAYFYKNLGKYNDAEPLYKEALEMRRRLFKGDHPDLALSLNNIAVFYHEMRNYNEAEPLFKEALEMYQRLFKEDHPDLAKSTHNMAGFYDDIGNYTEAEPLYKEALEMTRRLFKGDHPDLAASINNMAMFYNDRGNYTEAEPLFIESLNIYKNLFSKQSSLLSESEKDKYWNTMKHNFEGFNSFASSRLKNNPSIAGYVYDNLLFTKGLLLSSTMKIKNTIMNSGNNDLIRKYENWLWQKKNLAKYYSMTKDELAEKKINLDSLEKAANDREKELSKLSGEFAKLTEMREYKWQDVKKSLKNDEVAIELTRFRYQDVKRWTDTVYYSALIIKPDSKYPELVTLENGNDLESKYIELYRNQIEKQKRQTYDPDIISSSLQELYKQYWQPIAEKLDGVNKVYISLDGVYNQLNLNTLVNPKTGKYTLEELNIVQLTSTRELLDRQEILAEKEKTGNKTAVLFGDPKFDLETEQYIKLAANFNVSREYYDLNRAIDESERGRITPLPGTRVEVEKISKELTQSGWNVTKYLGTDAIEEAVKTLKNPTVLHIATHGKFLKDVEVVKDERILGMETQKFVENPLLKSFLLFTGSENTLNGERPSGTDDGLLTAYEAQGLYLDETELVVLSACETGLGQVRNGEGVYGLQRAFVQAGAKALIMSLWSVNDQTTQELMTDFYRNWLAGKSKRDAFIQAQQNLKRKYPGYYYWGAFILIGE